MKRCARFALILFCAAGLAACTGGNPSVVPPSGSAAQTARGISAHHAAGLGPVLSTSDGGQIFGFDIDQNGNDGVLASATSARISVQTFNQITGKIVKNVGVIGGKKVQNGNDYVANGIFAGDVALIDYQKAGIPGQTPTKDIYKVMNPVTGNAFTSKWTPPGADVNVIQNAVNQSTATSVVLGYRRAGSDPTVLVVSDVATNTFSKVIALDPNEFGLFTGPQLAQDTVGNRAVMASSPDGGAAGGPPPVIATIDLSSGKLSKFSGVNCPGSVGCGYANGIAYDSKTGVACTDTELDGGIEFYDVAKKTGTHEFLPNGGGQIHAGAYVINDPVHQLFLVAQPFSSTSQSGSSIQVYEENGTPLESINGFNFTDAGDLAIPVRIAINPSTRTGWVNGPQV
ncbi:MAG: hypothetical protein JOY69_03465, partial [Candidatus Eremiobacteraeota bacterium]|nr:hypothetical protein [Candidatus Eremiobacteraeota bacterium]